MRTLTKEFQEKITPDNALNLLLEGNKRFVGNLKLNRNLLHQVNETRVSQHPFAVIISCMDSRTSAELIFDQGLGDIFSIRIAGNIINEDILGSAEFGCKQVGAKIIMVLGHSGCSAVQGAIDNVDLGHLHYVTEKIRRCIPKNGTFSRMDLMDFVTNQNVLLSIEDIRTRSKIIAQLEHDKEICVVGAVYDLNTGKVNLLKS